MDMMDQKQWLSWLVRVRVVIITFLLGIELSIQQVARMQNLTIVQVPMKYFLAMLVFWCVLNLIYHILLKINADHTAQSYLQILLDTTMVSLIVYFTGGLDSYFYSLFPLTVLVGSIILSRGGAYLVASLTFIQAGLILELPFYGIVGFYGLAHPDLKELQIKIVANLAGFLAVAYLGSKLAENLRRTGIELKDLQALNQDIIESLRSGLITTDLNGLILLSNSTATEILGLPAESLKGQAVRSLFAEAANPEEMMDDRYPRREILWHSGSGQEKFLGLSISPLSRNGQAVGYVYHFQDVTQLKQLEMEIQLKDRMAAIGRMAAAIAHEIRNPLASIAGAVKVVAEMVDLNQDQQRLIQIVLKESKRLNTIISDFLLYSREKNYKFELVNVGDVLEETLTLLQNHPNFDGRCRIEKDLPAAPVFASVDADRMRQVFWNLGDNALKAMPQGGTLSAQIVQHGERLQILFRDTGNGIATRQIGKIFEPFQSGFEGGTGLGLAIVYEIVQAHKGTVHAESSQHGCTFRIELPNMSGAARRDLRLLKTRG